MNMIASKRVLGLLLVGQVAFHPAEAQPKGQPEFPAPRYVHQRQDHFDSSNEKMWWQAYYVNETFWEPGSDMPIFLCVGGEGPALDGSAVVASVHCNVAVEWLRERRALMFALEHRYYGCHNMSACPVERFSSSGGSRGAASDLKFLSSRQAVEDVAAFIGAMTSEYALVPGKNLWITWGGSYPGMLAGWSRMKHPELIHASVASSAPVFPKLEMPEYFDHVAYAFSVSDAGVGGSMECQDAIREGHAWIEDKFRSSEGIREVESLFGLPAGSLATKEGRTNFGAQGVADFPAQANDPLCTEPACNIASICMIMTNATYGSPVHRLLRVRSLQSSLQARPRSLELGASLWKSQPHDMPDFWLYQTCTEFGFYQTCNQESRCMFVRGLLTLGTFTAQCEAYGISPSDIERSINATNEHYGGLRPIDRDGRLGSCVLWPNGQVDPWSTLSILEAPSPQLPVLYVLGASHHSWTWPSRPGDSAELQAARKTIRGQVEEWLETPSCAYSAARFLL